MENILWLLQVSTASVVHFFGRPAHRCMSGEPRHQGGSGGADSRKSVPRRLAYVRTQALHAEASRFRRAELMGAALTSVYHVDPITAMKGRLSLLASLELVKRGCFSHSIS